MKKSILTLSLVCGVAFANIAANQQILIYVSPEGSDQSDGLANAPVATFGKALELASETAGISTDIHIILGNGTYYLPDTAMISEKIAGNPDSHLYIEAADGENPVLSGAIPISDWQEAGAVAGLPDVANGKVLVANVAPTQKQYRQMWVNGNRAKKASNHDDLSLPRIISRDAEGNGLVVPALQYDFRKPQEVEATIIQDWAMNILRVKSIKTEGEKSFLKFGDTESEYLTSRVRRLGMPGSGGRFCFEYDYQPQRDLRYPLLSNKYGLGLG